MVEEVAIAWDYPLSKRRDWQGRRTIRKVLRLLEKSVSVLEFEQNGNGREAYERQHL
jgi:hypothetical protein